MKIEYMQPFIEAALLTLGRVSGKPTTLGAPSLMKTAFPGSSVNVVSKIRGALHGDVICSMSPATAQSLAESLAGTPAHDFGDTVRSALASFAREWSGHARAFLQQTGLGCEVSEPVVFQGLNVEMATTQPALTAPIDTPAGQVNITVAVDHAR